MFCLNPPLYITLLSLAALAFALDYHVINSCPGTITVYNTQAATGTTLGQGGDFYGSLVGSGSVFTDAGGGTVTGGATRATFHADGDGYYYYIEKDVTHFNTGIRITPNHDPDGGYCPVARCDAVSCASAFSQPTTSLPPLVVGITPTPPAYTCPDATLSYLIEFCPVSCHFPAPPVEIHPNGDPDYCLDVQGGAFTNGTPVQIYKCNKTKAQKWFINPGPGNTQVRVADTNFCLDASATPGNAVQMKIWQCYDNLPAQQWYYSSTDRIALVGKGQCLDLPNGVLTNRNIVQTWQCSPKNTNQVWTTVPTS